ncbi:MAG: hypothetical protein H8E79_00160 [Desulfobulbaceae bacterium]|uniref:Uncharacterized protein n=1 Tax=Candidatus Desulfatifera sulfidica TaxID=2841691 RepID=A0A8J6N6K9_9BACT|nr:hypothetical protein [Candidatus Desulfatifera sulfidica]
MNILTTLYFPQTQLPVHHRLPLSLLFDQLHLLQPVEKAPDHAPVPDDDHFMESDFCQVHTPAPLGTDRDRFLHLVQDIRERKDDYTSQLSALTLAALSGKEQTQERSHNDILGALRQSHTRTPDSDETLWQARLVLKIGEILDTEEDELNLEIASLSEQKDRLFKELKGENSSPESSDDDDDLFTGILEQQEQISRPSGATLRNRFRAWQKLYQAEVIPDLPTIWTTRCQESAELILDAYENRSGRTALPLLQLELPARLPGHDTTERIAAFHNETANLHQTLRRKLHELTHREELILAEADVLLPEAREYQEQWRTALDTHFPGARYGRLSLTVHLLANISLEHLLRDDGQTPSGHGLLAVIS